MATLRLRSPTGVLSAEAAGFGVGALLRVAFGTTLAVVRIADGGLLANRALPGSEPPAVALAPSGNVLDSPDLPDLPDAADLRLVEVLDRTMTHDHAYRIDDLTLGVLALKLAVPEYRLRRAINRHLGHRNFNAYINGLRLAEARAALADPARQTASVLEIALEAGFASIGPFNRAFKAASNMTPTEYRERTLADS